MTTRKSPVLALTLLLTMLFSASFWVVGCEDSGITGSLNDNQAPNTSMTIDEVNRSGENRLISQIRLSWWGDDPDGYVNGFEFRINENANWRFTTRNDSTFILPIPEGQDSADVRFEVRAIDNDGLSDPSPATVQLPIKNSVPQVRFRQLETPPDTTFTLFGFGWDASDPDGDLNLKYTEIAFNDSLNGWVQIPVEEELVHFEMDANGTASLFFGTTYRSSELQISGLIPNAENTLYVRVIDQALRESDMIQYSWFVKPQLSSVLVLHDDESSDGDARVQSYLSILANQGYTFDLWNISDGSANGPLSSAFPATTEPTLLKTLEQWDTIVWYTNDIERNLRFAQDITRDFFANGGKMLATGPAKRLANDDPLLTFIPISSFGDLTGLQTGFILNANTDIVSSNAQAPALKTNRRLNTSAPFFVAPGATSVYEAEFRVTTILGSTQPYEGAKSVSVMNPEANFLFFGFEPADVTDDSSLDPLFRFLLSDELNIQAPN